MANWHGASRTGILVCTVNGRRMFVQISVSDERGLVLAEADSLSERLPVKGSAESQHVGDHAGLLAEHEIS
jgi:hypothetical protein